MENSAIFNIRTQTIVKVTLDNKPPFYKIFDLIKYYKAVRKIKLATEMAVRGIELKHRTLRLLGKELSYEETMADYRKIPEYIFGEDLLQSKIIN